MRRENDLPENAARQIGGLGLLTFIAGALCGAIGANLLWGEGAAFLVVGAIGLALGSFIIWLSLKI